MSSILSSYRRATHADIPAIVELVNLAYRDDKLRGWTTEADIVEGDRIHAQQLLELIAAPGSAILVMTLGTDLQGCVHLQARGNEVYLGMLTIAPLIQNRGLGKGLLQEAEHHAREEMGGELISMIVVSQRTELIDFYLRRGYRRSGEVSPYPVERNVGRPRVEGLTMEKLVKILTV
jgi:ribosomal protein S18 acetylase RimI-like enzyme